MTHADQWYAFETSWGWMATAWRRERLFALSFGHKRSQQAVKMLGGNASPTPPAAVQAIHRQLKDYADGTIDGLVDIDVDIDDRTPFQQAVLQACRRIPPGSTCSYGELAAECGRPRAARAVGNVMRTNRHPLVIPCHRVVGSSGKLIGFSAPGGLNMKEQLLAREATC